MFKTREILKSAKENVKNNFGVFFFAVLIYYVIFGIVDGSFGFFSVINEMITNIRMGNFVREVFLNPESEMLLSLTSNPFVAVASVISIPAGILLLNPLLVGLCGVFVKGTEGKTTIVNLFLPFKKNYKKFLATTFLKYVLMTIITLGLSMAMFFVVGTMFALFYFAVNNVMEFGYILELIFQILIVAVMIAFTLTLIKITYSFSMIEYIIWENPDIHFARAYVMSKEMTKKKKFRMFKVDFCYGILEGIIVIIPFVLIGIGLAKLSADLGGMLWFVMGIYLFIPVIILALLVEVYKRSAWANMYKKLKKDETQIFGEDIYKAPEVHEEIKYEDEE